MFPYSVLVRRYRGFSSRVTGSELETDRSTSSSVEVKNACTYTPPIRLHDLPLHNFTFTFLLLTESVCLAGCVPELGFCLMSDMLVVQHWSMFIC